MNKKIFFALLILAISIMTVSSVNAFLGNGENLIEITSVGLYDNYSGGNFGGAIDSSIAQRENDAQMFDDSNNVAEGALPSSDSYDYDINLGMIINFIPKETLKDVTAIRVENVEVTYKDGSVQKVGSATFDDNRGDLEKNENYSLPVSYNLDQELWDEKIPLKDFYGKSHVKADIIINSSTETNKVIGHVDEDITETG